FSLFGTRHGACLPSGMNLARPFVGAGAALVLLLAACSGAIAPDTGPGSSGGTSGTSGSSGTSGTSGSSGTSGTSGTSGRSGRSGGTCVEGSYGPSCPLDCSDVPQPSRCVGGRYVCPPAGPCPPPPPHGCEGPPPLCNCLPGCDCKAICNEGGWQCSATNCP